MDRVVFVCMSSLKAVANVKYACRLLRLHEKKVPLPTPLALTSTSPVFDGCGFDRERGGVRCGGESQGELTILFHCLSNDGITLNKKARVLWRHFPVKTQTKNPLP